MTPERLIWWIVLGPLCALLILTVIVGARGSFTIYTLKGDNQ
jgi:hypothetical protein